jgi:tetratricopeptide (TPR) repeat protein
MLATLHILNGPRQGQSVPITVERVNIGRAADNVIVVAHETVSQHHAILSREGMTYRMRDLVSTNGSYRNGERITSTLLKDGDVIQVGEIKMRFELSAAPARSASVEDLLKSAAVQPVEPKAPVNRGTRSWAMSAVVAVLLVAGEMLAARHLSWWPFGAAHPLAKYGKQAAERVYHDQAYLEASRAEDTKDFESVLKQSRALISRYPEHHIGFYIQGVALATMGRHAEAAVSFMDAVERQPDFADGWSNLGWCRSHLRETEAAIQAFRKAVELAPADASVWSNLAGALADAGKSDEAAEAYRQVLKLRPADARAFYGLGMVLAGQRQHLEAVQSFREALKLAPNDADIWLQLGRMTLAQEQPAEALVFLQKADALRPNDPDIWGGYVQAYLQLGQTTKALEAAREMKRLDPAKASALADELE